MAVVRLFRLKKLFYVPLRFPEALFKLIGSDANFEWCEVVTTGVFSGELYIVDATIGYELTTWFPITRS